MEDRILSRDPEVRCKVGKAKLRKKAALNLTAILCILSWRIIWITMLNRIAPETSPNDPFEELDHDLLNELPIDFKCSEFRHRRRNYISNLAPLGLSRTRPSPPAGTPVIERGLARRSDIEWAS